MATETLNGPQVAELFIYLLAGGQVVNHEDRVPRSIQGMNMVNPTST